MTQQLEWLGFSLFTIVCSIFALLKSVWKVHEKSAFFCMKSAKCILWNEPCLWELTLWSNRRGFLLTKIVVRECTHSFIWRVQWAHYFVWKVHSFVFKVQIFMGVNSMVESKGSYSTKFCESGVNIFLLNMFVRECTLFYEECIF